MPLAEAREVVISPALLDALLRRAEASPGAEICGLLLGGDGRIDAAPPARNVAVAPGDSFELDPAALIAAYRAERRGGPRVIGHYHSHPRGPAEPSPRDATAAEGERLWLILGGGGARLWQAGAGGFRERRLVQR